MPTNPDHVVVVTSENRIQSGIEAVQDYVARSIAARHGECATIPDDVLATAVEAITQLLGGVLSKESDLEARIAAIEAGRTPS